MKMMVSPEQLFAQCALMGETPLAPRSANDKEYFAQDWLAHRLDELGFPYTPSGRNTYPDFWVGPDVGVFGVEVKGLAVNRGRPARSDFDTNSTIPSGEKNGLPVYVAFFLYERGPDIASLRIHSLCFMHGDVLNADNEMVHDNKAVHGFGSYGDAFIRDRKMYVFRTPFSIDPELLGEFRFVTPRGAPLVPTTPPLVQVGVLARKWADTRVVGYHIDIIDNIAEPEIEGSSRAGEDVLFDIWAPGG